MLFIIEMNQWEIFFKFWVLISNTVNNTRYNNSHEQKVFGALSDFKEFRALETWKFTDLEEFPLVFVFQSISFREVDLSHLLLPKIQVQQFWRYTSIVPHQDALMAGWPLWLTGWQFAKVLFHFVLNRLSVVDSLRLSYSL